VPERQFAQQEISATQTKDIEVAFGLSKRCSRFNGSVIIWALPSSSNGGFIAVTWRHR